jgi:hypothetical protein
MLKSGLRRNPESVLGALTPRPPVAEANDNLIPLDNGIIGYIEDVYSADFFALHSQSSLRARLQWRCCQRSICIGQF